MSGTQAVTPTPVQLPKQTPYAGSQAGRQERPQASKSPLWVRIVLAIICIAWVVPTFGLAITSFRNQTDATNSGWWTLFTSPANFTRLTFENYGDLFAQADMDTAFVNTLAITIPATIIPILIAAFAAYAFTFMQFPGRDLLLILIVGLLVVPTQVALVPLLKIFGSLGINGTFPAVWIAHIGFGMPLAVYIIRNYMATLPAGGHRVGQDRRGQPLPDLLEADPADVHPGARVLRDLPVPLGVERPAQRADLHRAQQQRAAVHRPGPLLGQQGQGWQLLTAGGLFMMIVPILVFLSLQRYFVRGMTAGAVKG